MAAEDRLRAVCRAYGEQLRDRPWWHGAVAPKAVCASCSCHANRRFEMIPAELELLPHDYRYSLPTGSEDLTECNVPDNTRYLASLHWSLCMLMAQKCSKYAQLETFTSAFVRHVRHDAILTATHRNRLQTATGRSGACRRAVQFIHSHPYHNSGVIL